MKNLLVLLLFASSLFLRAQSLFDGTWKMKMDTLQFSGSPEDYLFAHGMYHCKSCIPKVDVKTDGVDHEAGYSYDTLAVRILDEHAIKFTRCGWLSRRKITRRRFTFIGMCWV